MHIFRPTCAFHRGPRARALQTIRRARSTLSVGGGGAQLVHGTRNWESDRPRRSILYKYSPGYSTWGNPEALAPARELASTEPQRQLLRPPGVKWGDANARL